MTLLPEPLKRLVDRLAKLPSIGPRQATRLAFHLIGRGENSIRSLASDLDDLRKIKVCERCFFVHQNSGSLCDICVNKNRDQKVIMVVEKETDLLSLEKTDKFNGRYFILGVIHKTGILEEWQKLRLENLKKFIQKELGSGAEEIILAFNPTSQGDYNASLIVKELKPFAKKISRLGRGIPTGGEIEFADEETLSQALERRN
jgi:recombination protein RecR